MQHDPRFSRRGVLTGIGGSLALGILPTQAAQAPSLPAGLPLGTAESAVLESLPGKRPLIRLTSRPLNYETPVQYFSTAITPNEAFFVRYHLSGMPERTDRATWKIEVGGETASTPFTLTIADLESKYEQVELAAVCQCSGNRRGFSEPHVPGVQWGYGAMGNAIWRGARLKDVLAKAGIAGNTVEIVMDGADSAPISQTPDFVKSIPIEKALEENAILATRMNGENLPLLHGAPVRLILPGWTATYWMKHVVSIRAVAKPFDGFWMKGAYRLPNGLFPTPQIFRTQQTDVNTPITEIVVNSVVASPSEGQQFRAGQSIAVQGVAFDGGYGITRVAVSTDGGANWQDATLGPDGGRFGFRPWSYNFTATARGTLRIMSKAYNRSGQTQTDKLVFNPAGYHNNVTRTTNVIVA